MGTREALMDILVNELAKDLSIAIQQDKEKEGCDISAGLYGQAVAMWLRTITEHGVKDAKDAARYRWLKEHMSFHRYSGTRKTIVWQHIADSELNTIDEVVDQQMRRV